MRHRTFSLALLTLGLLQSRMPAAAQETDATKTKVLAPIEVQARFWTEDVFDVPGTVETIDGEKLSRPLWDDPSSLAKVSPNTQVQQSSVETRVVVRGMTAINTGLQDPVGYFVNGVALPMGVAQAPQLFDLDQLEIVKGPQGTLYGRNTEAGAIVTRTAEPTWEPSFSLQAEPSLLQGPGKWEPAIVSSGRISGPLTDDLAASAALRYETSNGVYHNLFDGSDAGGDIDRLTFSGGVTALFGDRTEVNLRSVVDDNKRGKERMRYLNGAFATDPYTTNYNTDSWDKTDSAVQSLQVDYDFDDAKLTAITGWTRFRRTFRMDLDAANLATQPSTLDHDDDTLSQEIRLASDSEGALQWLAGLYTYRQWSDLDFGSGTPHTRRRTDIDQFGLAAFGNVEYEVLDGLRLGLGNRVEWIRQDGDQILDTSTTRSRYGERMDAVTLLPKVSISYDVSDQLVLYGSYARGYLPGGYNYSMATNAGNLTYDPEYSWTGEIGAKARLLDDRLNVNVSGFHTTTHDRQMLELQPGGAQSISNAAKAEIYGAEFSADFRVTPDIVLFGNAGVQHAEATSYKTTALVGGALTSVDLSGKRLPFAADYTYGLGLRYDTGGDGLFAETGLNGSGPYYFDSQNLLKQRAFVLVDAELGYRWRGFEVSLWANNIFGEKTYSRALNVPAGTIVEDGAPREVGLRLTARW